MATHSGIPAWRTPWTEENVRPQSMGLQDRTNTQTHTKELGTKKPSKNPESFCLVAPSSACQHDHKGESMPLPFLSICTHLFCPHPVSQNLISSYPSGCMGVWEL